MNAANDVAITVIKDYGWEPIRTYANSLARSGFQGTKLMFVQNIQPEAKNRLTDLGFQLVDFTFLDPARGFGTVRFKPVIDFLQSNKNYRYIIWTDMRDAIFQTDPSPWLEQNLAPHKLLAASECVTIESEFYNRQWINQAFNAEICAWLGKCEICNSGCFAGDADVMLGVFSEIYDISLRSNERTGAFLDQAMFNYAIRTSPFKKVLRITRAEEFFASCNFFLIPSQFTGVSTHPIPAPVIDPNTGLIYPAKGDEPFSVVHQYDRDPKWKESVENRYKD